MHLGCVEHPSGFISTNRAACERVFTVTWVYTVVCPTHVISVAGTCPTGGQGFCRNQKTLRRKASALRAAKRSTKQRLIVFCCLMYV